MNMNMNTIHSPANRRAIDKEKVRLADLIKLIKWTLTSLDPKESSNTIADLQEKLQVSTAKLYGLNLKR